MQQLLEGYFEELYQTSDLMQNWRKKGWDLFQKIGLPHFKKEPFRYLSLDRLHFHEPAQKGDEGLGEKSHIVFSNGFFQKSSIAAPAICLGMDEAMKSYGVFLQNRLSKILKEEQDPFAALNIALQGRGAFLYIPPHSYFETPLEILQLLKPSTLSSTRLHIYLGKGAHLKVEHQMKLCDRAFANSVIDITLDEGAHLEWYEYQNRAQAQVFQSMRAQLKKGSHFKSFSFFPGNSLSRHSIKVELEEENAQAELKGLSFLKENLEEHIYINVEHLAPHCQSKQHFKSILQDESKSSFEGKIYVKDQAQKTQAYQLSNQLLLSNRAKGYAKPNLEIFADDVKASHGATFAQLNPEELFYLQSRGLSKKEAEEWVIRAFTQEFFQPLPSFYRDKIDA